MKIKDFAVKLINFILVSSMIELALCFRLTTLDRELLMNRINETKADDILKILNVNVYSNSSRNKGIFNSTLLNSSNNQEDQEDVSLTEEDVLKSNCK